ncbi:MAG: type II toxin-antitoxin system VapC family toxin [Oscillospiraceae bacterium]|nr:type II toxin-antitoxin system VapC family toxin [Oscillospiraceae bacterium]
MNLLLDTHTILWALADDEERLSKPAREAILSPGNQKFVSLASAWELAIKISSGKLSFEGGADNFAHQVESNGFLLLPIERSHIARTETLPFHHRDPFDRLLVAAALCEGLAIVTADEHIPAYGVPCIW